MLHTDAAAAFRGERATAFFEMCSILHTKTTPYYPQSDGLAEAGVKKVVNLLTSLVLEDQDADVTTTVEWDKRVKKAQYAINAFPNQPRFRRF